jgi:hypothetical protein
MLKQGDIIPVTMLNIEGKYDYCNFKVQTITKQKIVTGRKEYGCVKCNYAIKEKEEHIFVSFTAKYVPTGCPLLMLGYRWHKECDDKKFVYLVPPIGRFTEGLIVVGPTEEAAEFESITPKDMFIELGSQIQRKEKADG